MELEFLGTGAGVPAKFRNVTSIALKLLDERNAVWLFDVGEGTQQQILKTHLRPRKIEKIFITHLHGDHIYGLPGLLSSRSFQGGERPLTLYGPKGLKNFVLTTLRVTESKLKYKLEFVEIAEEGLIFADKTFKVYCRRLDHRIESFGYRIEEMDHQGELQVEKLHALGVQPGPIYAQLKAKKEVVYDGTILNGADFVGPAKKGRIVTILGDTRKNPNSVALAQDADVLVHESTFSEDETKMARDYYHSTSKQAAQVAQAAQVKLLLLTHISARYLGKASGQLKEEAQRVFANTRVVKDFDVIAIPFESEVDLDESSN